MITRVRQRPLARALYPQWALHVALLVVSGCSSQPDASAIDDFVRDASTEPTPGGATTTPHAALPAPLAMAMQIAKTDVQMRTALDAAGAGFSRSGADIVGWNGVNPLGGRVDVLTAKLPPTGEGAIEVGLG